MNQETLTYETGAKTHGANDIVLTLMNDGSQYENRKHCGFAMLQGENHRDITFRSLCSDTAKANRKQFGSLYSAADISEAARVTKAQTIAHCLELIRDEWNGKTVSCTARRWFDSANGNSYFSARIEVPREGGWNSVIVPFQYGYGSHWEHVCAHVLEKIGLVGATVDYTDRGYGLKKHLHADGIHLSYK